MLPPRSPIVLATLLYATQRSVASYVDHPRRSGRLHNPHARDASSGLVFSGGGYNINITMGGAPYAVMIDTGRWASYPSVHRQRSERSPSISVRSPALIFG